jgi:predicted  nucleic acid-binding Zn-ribbon protein
VPQAKISDQDEALERELSRLKAEYERLHEEKVRAEQSLSHLQDQLRELEEKARAEYGTADPEELNRLLEGMRAENQRLIDEYRRHVDEVRAGLAGLEREAEA